MSCARHPGLARVRDGAAPKLLHPSWFGSARCSTPGSAGSRQNRSAHKVGKQRNPGPAGSGKQDGAEWRGFTGGSPGVCVPCPGPSRFISLPALSRALCTLRAPSSSGGCLHRWSSGQECEPRGRKPRLLDFALQTPLSHHPEQPERSEVSRIKIHQEQAFTACSVPEFLLLFTLVLIPTQVGVTEVKGQTQTFCLELFNLPSFIFRAKPLLKLHERTISAFFEGFNQGKYFGELNTQNPAICHCSQHYRTKRAQGELIGFFFSLSWSPNL